MVLRFFIPFRTVHLFSVELGPRSLGAGRGAAASSKKVYLLRRRLRISSLPHSGSIAEVTDPRRRRRRTTHARSPDFNCIFAYRRPPPPRSAHAEEYICGGMIGAIFAPVTFGVVDWVAIAIASSRCGRGSFDGGAAE